MRNSFSREISGLSVTVYNRFFFFFVIDSLCSTVEVTLHLSRSVTVISLQYIFDSDNLTKK